MNNNYFGYNGKKFVCLNCQKDSDSEDDINLDSEDLNINVNDGNDSARVRIDKNGIRVESKDGSVGLNLPRTENKKEKSNQEIHYKDDTDSININYRNHSNNRWFLCIDLRSILINNIQKETFHFGMSLFIFGYIR